MGNSKVSRSYSHSHTMNSTGAHDTAWMHLSWEAESPSEGMVARVARMCQHLAQ